MIEVFETARGAFALLDRRTGKLLRRRGGQVVTHKFEEEAQARADQLNQARA